MTPHSPLCSASQSWLPIIVLDPAVKGTGTISVVSEACLRGPASRGDLSSVKTFDEAYAPLGHDDPFTGGLADFNWTAAPGADMGDKTTYRCRIPGSSWFPSLRMGSW